MKVFKKQNYIQVIFSDGSSFDTTENAQEIMKFVQENINNEEIVRKKLLKDDSKGKNLLKRVEKSRILTLRGTSVYMLGVSELTIPEDFVVKILDAEDDNNEAELAKFKNFWTLVSLNPDSRVRNNLFWFIRKWDMKIADSGLIIAYRNADIKKESKYSTHETKNIINIYYEEKYLNHNNPYAQTIFLKGEDVNLGEAYDEIVNEESSPIYTDQHTHTMEIRLGHPVRMSREECDADQEHSCSRGLHTGAKGWLKQNYYGSVGLMVLVDPSKIVAVPTIDNYGKMRTCEYYPVAVIDFDEHGDVIEPAHNLYSDVAYLKEIKQSGNINNHDVDCYEIAVSDLTREDMYESILRSLNAD